MVLGVVTRVVKLLPKVFHVPVNVLRLDLQEQGVRVCVEQVHSRAVLLLQMLVVEVVHQGLGKIQDAHARVDWTLEDDFALVHLDASQGAVEDQCSCKQGACGKLPILVSLVRPDKLHVDAVSEVLHCLAEDRVVHELEEVLFEIRCGPLPELGVQGNVRLHPRPLLELEDFVDLPQPHPKV